MNKNIKGLNIMHHTHWDREWYESFEEFRYKLRNGLRYVQELIEDGTIKCFFVDGQTMVIDDYKEIVSKEEFDKFKKLISEGKVEIGPWYVLADEFLVGGESLVKNLELGTNIAKEFGSNYNIGYLPDTFGHISQMPQVLKQYGIDNAILWRGAVSSSFENHWIGSDGSSVLAFVLPLFDGYFQTYMKHNEWKEKLNKYINDNLSYCKNGEVLVMNGADHTYTSRNIGQRIKEFKKINPDLNVDEVLMSDYVKKFENFVPENNIFGEQRNQNKIYTLPGVFSTRMYLKQENQRCEDGMINTLEFLNAWTNGGTKSDEFITYLWKLLIQNHAHDSICGCSIDEVHEEMETRFKKILAAINQFKTSTLEELYPWDYLANDFVNDKLYLLNNVPFKGEYIVESEVLVPEKADKGGIELSYKAEKIDFELLSRIKEEVLFRDIKIEPYYAIVYKYKVRFKISFDGIESKVLNIKLTEQINKVREQIQSVNYIENDFYKVGVNNRGLTILDKKNKKTYQNQNIIVSSLDAGDTYNYSPPNEDIITEGKIIKINSCYKNSFSEEITFTYDLNIPKGLSEDRTSGSNELINVKVTTKVTLINGIDKILFVTKVNNVSENHKLRIGFNLGSCDKHYSDTPFDLISRGVLRDQCFDVLEGEELECNQHPTLSTIFANDIQIVHLGIQEYEVCKYDNEDYCFMTALRCVGDLSRRDLRTRGGGAGPGYETPGAQCQGEHTFNYSLIIGKEKFNINNKNVIRNKVLTKQSNITVTDKNLFTLDNNEISYSSLIRKPTGEIQLRLFNCFNEDKETTIKFNSQFTKAELVTLESKGIESLNIINNEVKIKVRAKEICTISLKYIEEENKNVR